MKFFFCVASLVSREFDLDSRWVLPQKTKNFKDKTGLEEKSIFFVLEPLLFFIGKYLAAIEYLFLVTMNTGARNKFMLDKFA